MRRSSSTARKREDWFDVPVDAPAPLPAPAAVIPTQDPPRNPIPMIPGQESARTIDSKTLLRQLTALKAFRPDYKTSDAMVILEDQPLGFRASLVLEKSKDEVETVISATSRGTGLGLPDPISVSLKLLMGAARTIEGNLRMKLDRDDLVLESEDTSHVLRFPSPTAKTVPALPEAQKTVAIPASTFHEMLARTLYAMSTDPAREHLHAAFLEAGEGKVKITATDGHRLTHAEADHPCPPFFQVIVPAPIMSWLLRSTSKDSTESVVTVMLGEKHVVFSITSPGDMLLDIWTVIPEATYPNYHQVIPSKQEKTLVRTPRMRMYRAIKTLEGAGETRVLLAANGRTSLTGMVTSSQALLQADHLGKDATVGFDIRYLREALESMTADEVDLRMWDELDPVRIKDSTPGSIKVLNVTMPRRL